VRIILGNRQRRRLHEHLRRVAIAIGPGAEAVARGIGATAVSIGNGAETAVNGAFSYGSSVGNGLVFVGNINGTDFGNIAMPFGDDSETQAGNPGGGGVFNMATNFGMPSTLFCGFSSSVSTLGFLTCAISDVLTRCPSHGFSLSCPLPLGREWTSRSTQFALVIP
jgi:hypothetical protein